MQNNRVTNGLLALVAVLLTTNLITPFLFHSEPAYAQGRRQYKVTIPPDDEKALNILAKDGWVLDSVAVLPTMNGSKTALYLHR